MAKAGHHTRRRNADGTQLGYWEPPKLCCVPDCGRVSERADSLCAAHGRRVDRTGDLRADVPLRTYTRSP
jgi:hypothetical protein